jgi:hypothetical protein
MSSRIGAGNELSKVFLVGSSILAPRTSAPDVTAIHRGTQELALKNHSPVPVVLYRFLILFRWNLLIYFPVSGMESE